jgi:hypothetical protein
MTKPQFDQFRRKLAVVALTVLDIAFVIVVIVGMWNWLRTQ